LQESTDKSFFAKYAFEKYDPEFISRCKKYDSNIVIGGENFGCGSSREQAVYAFTYNNVKAIIAKSFPDIFYRNSINNGLVLIKFPNVEVFKMGDKIEIDLDNKKIIVN
jgi:3-isopropylmalate dehydratase small subunit